jgi:hypothetical protein
MVLIAGLTSNMLLGNAPWKERKKFANQQAIINLLEASSRKKLRRKFFIPCGNEVYAFAFMNLMRIKKWPECIAERKAPLAHGRRLQARRLSGVI